MIYNDGLEDRIGTKIPIGERCPKTTCISDTFQCVHEMVIDGMFILDKWNTKWWNCKIYKEQFGEGNHLMSAGTSCSDCDVAADDSCFATELDTIVCPVLGPTCSTQSSTNNTPFNRTRTDRSPGYNDLMKSFAPLAADLLKCPVA